MPVVSVDFSCFLASQFNLIPLLLQLLSNVETLYREILDVLESLEKKSSFPTDSCDVHSQITELKDMLRIEGNDYQVS